MPFRLSNLAHLRMVEEDLLDIFKYSRKKDIVHTQIDKYSLS